MNIGFQPTSTAERPDDEITNDGFFPSLSLSEFQTQYSLPSDVSNEQVKRSLLVSAAQVNQALWHFKTQAMAKQHSRLADIPTVQLNGEPANVLHYKQAVYCKTKSALVREQISLARKPNAESEAKTGDDLVHFYETQASAAIANVQSKRMIGVALL